MRKNHRVWHRRGLGGKHLESGKRLACRRWLRLGNGCIRLGGGQRSVASRRNIVTFPRASRRGWRWGALLSPQSLLIGLCRESFPFCLASLLLPNIVVFDLENCINNDLYSAYNCIPQKKRRKKGGRELHSTYKRSNKKTYHDRCLRLHVRCNRIPVCAE